MPASEQTNEQLAELTKLLLDWLVKTFGEAEMFKVIEPLLPILARLGMEVGLEQVQVVLNGLAGEDSLEYWDQIVALATAEERVVIMASTFQLAAADCLRKVERNKALSEAFKTFLSILVSALGLLLL